MKIAPLVLAAIRSLALTVVCLSAGCARYEYEIVDPPELRLHVGERADAVFSRPPLVYRMRSYENHLVISIQNPTPAPITLLGGQSFVVDPQGQSHPLMTQTIPPGAFIKVILPPVPPEPVPTGPTFGFGFVVDAWEPPAAVTGTGGAQTVRPIYAQADIADDFWKWDGETDVRAGFTFRQGEQPPIAQAFVFHRKKM